MGLGYLFGSIIKILAMIAWIYGLMWVLGHRNWWVKVGGVIAAFGIIQLALSLQFGDFQIFSDFDNGLLFQSCTMAMVAIGLNLIYGFNGQFSLGQWGFYGLGAYCAADITFRWFNGDSRGLFVVGVGTILGGLAIWGIGRFISRTRGIPVMSSFTLYLIGGLLAAVLAVFFANAINPALAPLLGTDEVPGVLNSPAFQQIIFFLAVLLGGVFSAEISFLFGLPVLTLGSDYFGIATLGFTIVVTTLMVNTDTILPFPEMKGGRGMIGISKMTTWFWAFFFLLIVIILVRNLIHSSTGRAIMAVRDDETAAKAMGIDVAGNKLLAFVVGSFFAGIGGGVYAHYIGFLSPNTFSFITGFNPLIIIVFGGLGSISGTLAATFGWTFFLEGLLRNLLGQLGTEAPTWRYVLYPVTLLLLMLLRPEGLLGRNEWGFLKAKIISVRKKATKEPDSVPVA
ncbi:MAG: branched-chain amino acid ABC transporter permease [Anaerolineaceae bacterium]|jgi:branched-chain amino acid transport system permease protein